MKKQTNARHAALVLGAAAMTAVLFAGCGVHPYFVVQPTDLRVQIQPGNPYENAIGLGEMTSKTVIHPGFVEGSLKESLKNVGFLAGGSNPQYKVNADIVSLTAPNNNTSRIAIHFSLVEVAINAEIYRNTLTGEYEYLEATAGGPEMRVHYSRWNAIRLAVEEFLNEIIEAGIVR